MVNQIITSIGDVVKHRQQIALFLCKQKYSLIPLKPNSKIPYVQLLPLTDDGQASWNMYAARRATEPEVKNWFLCDPNCNYGIITGNGLVVLDVDQPKKLPKQNLPPTVTVRTGRGYHYYFKSEHQINSKKFPFGDLKSDGGYVVGPGSLHESGATYEFCEMLSLAEIEIAELPEWLLVEDSARAAKPLTGLKEPKTALEPNDLKPKDGVRKNSLTCSISFDQLWRLNQEPETAFKVMALCGRDVSRIGQAFTCPIPGHSERKPSAALWQGDAVGDAVVMNDFHEREAGRFSWPLVDVYASVKVGKALKLQKGERAIWWLRALHEIGAVNPPVLNRYELPAEAKKPAIKLYGGFVYLMELRQLYAPQDSAPFSWGFASKWCDIKSAGQVQQAMKYLLERGYLYMKQPGVKIGDGDGPRSALFAIGRPKV